MRYEVCEANCDNFYDAMEGELMRMTFLAHKAALFEKVKQKIEQEEGEKLDKIATLLVGESRTRMQEDREAEREYDDFRSKLREAFGD
ncbi:MAG: hypothetical protein HY364_00590 [Candidatus Aenigmarchaeota archaeon]|nr:hypothetical protein [Candidatus Aenigmarchaeota archaeon]